MIEINLLPEYLRVMPEKEKEKKRGEALLKKSIFRFAGILSAVLLTLYLLLVTIPAAVHGGRAHRYDRDWEALKSDFADIDAVIQKERNLTAKEARLKGQKTTGYTWSMILNAISDATPRSVQLTAVRNEVSQEFVIEKVTVTQGGKKVEKEQRGVKFNRVLVISGTFSPAKKDDDLLDAFVDSLEETPVFKRLFDHVELLSYATTQGGKKVFSVKCWFKEEKKPPVPGKEI